MQRTPIRRPAPIDGTVLLFAAVFTAGAAAMASRSSLEIGAVLGVVSIGLVVMGSVRWAVSPLIDILTRIEQKP